MSDDAQSKPAAPDRLEALFVKMEKTAIRDEVRREVLEEVRTANGYGLKIPKLTLRSSRRYIAGVATAVQNRQLDGAQANAMLYAAQLLIAAEKLASAPPPKRVGRPPKSVTLEGTKP